MPPHFRHQSSLEGIIDFSADQHSRATSIFNRIVSHYEPSQTQDEPYKRITLIRVTHEYAISQETFLGYFFLNIHNAVVGDGESVSNSSFSQALAHFANFDSWDTERKDVLRERLCGFADYLLDNFFLPLKASGRKTPQPSPSPHSATQPGQQLSGTSQRLSTLRHNCLIRDRHRCVVSHKFDKNEAIIRARRDGINATDDDGYWLRDERMELDYLEVAHILPHSLMSFKASDGQSQLSESKKLTLAILNMFDTDVVHLIEDNDIDRPRNALTMTQNLHHAFGDFEIYFEPVTDVRHKYKIDSIQPYNYLRNPLFPVTRAFFLTPDHNIDPPHPRFLTIHRACVFIMHLSGVGEYIDRILRDLEEVVVREDGSTALGHLVGLRLDGWLNEIRVQ